jgi:hypothetical protein
MVPLVGMSRRRCAAALLEVSDGAPRHVGRVDQVAGRSGSPALPGRPARLGHRCVLKAALDLEARADNRKVRL